MSTRRMELTEKPLLMLDVDGAVCPYKTPAGATVARIWGLSVPIVPENRERLAILNNLFRILWCSDWLENANLVGEAFGLPELPYVPIPDRPPDQTPSYDLPDPTGKLDYLWESHPLTFPEDFDDRKGAGSPSMFRKVPAVARYLAEFSGISQPFAWVDDHINFEARAFARDWPAQTLLIRTRRDVGLTDEVVDRLVRFARQTV